VHGGVIVVGVVESRFRTMAGLCGLDSVREEAGVGFSKGGDVIRPDEAESGFVGRDDVSTF